LFGIVFSHYISCSSIDYYLVIIEFGLDVLDFKFIILDLKNKIKKYIEI